MPLTPEQKALVKATVPILEKYGETITATFYRNLLRDNPSFRNIFNSANQAHMAQPKALAHSVYAYAKHIDDPSVLGPTIELIANKHASLLVRAEHYPIVGKYLLGAMAEVLGDALTPDVVDAWTVAYGELADVFIKVEQDLYNQTNGWTYWREFRITKKVVESTEITSFWLAPVDGQSLPEFKPGQYVSVMIDVPSLGHAQTRQYSLSDAPLADHWRISVKKEAGLNANDPASATAPGLVSTLLHDTKNEGDIIKLSHPMGNFVLDSLDATDDKPLVLISGGIGQTPLTSILNSLVSRSVERPISWIHAARAADVRAFASDIDNIAKTKKNVRAVFFDATPRNGAMGENLAARQEGKFDLSKVDKQEELFLSQDKTEYYVCGPTGFMLEVERALVQYGVDPGRIHMELFGVGGVPRVTA
ncbi:uncharacterized protein PV09_06508 [Verruconis gallopava]|uniref:nitric oxide dioxygenase n=1 Tax=Verruconis gallopava TaxID=253628 RepID=A0A0D2A657_9PEZI|nr:uncharacterized protein PV09_06508 [Verruconis gallopava]KIW02000.1 hypothetical protein PV09_06508 [Verruconis gallopava]